MLEYYWGRSLSNFCLNGSITEGREYGRDIK